MQIWRNGTEFCVLPFDLEVSKLASMRQSREFFPWPRGVATSQCTFVVVVYCLYSLILLKLQRTSWFDTFPAFYCHQKTIQVVKDMAPINLPFNVVKWNDCLFHRTNYPFSTKITIMTSRVEVIFNYSLLTHCLKIT